LACRTEILQQILSFTPVDVTKHLFPLPPALEMKRKSAYSHIAQLKTQIQQTLKTEQSASTLALQNSSTKASEIAAVVQKISTLRANIAALDKEILCQPIYKSGNHFIYFGKGNQYSTTVPSPVFELDKHSVIHNCVIDKHNREDNGILHVTIKPDWINIVKKKHESDQTKRNWYAYVAPSYNGSTFHAAEITESKNAKEAQEALKEQKDQEYSDLKTTANNFSESAKQHQTRLDEFTNQERVLADPGLYTVEAMKDVAEILKKFMKV